MIPETLNIIHIYTHRFLFDNRTRQNISTVSNHASNVIVLNINHRITRWEKIPAFTRCLYWFKIFPMNTGEKRFYREPRTFAARTNILKKIN